MNDSRTGTKSNKDVETVWQTASQWFARTIAVTLIMIVPGLLGAFLDRKLGTSFLSPAGFVVGLVLGTVGLVVLARKLTPPARGKPIPWDDEAVKAEEEASQN